MRKFKTGAIRDTNNGKISYYGFRHPLVEHSFGKYMLKHQKCADGSIREANNWWGGWSTDISIDSLTRHVVDLEAIHAGYRVFKVRQNDKEKTVIIPKDGYKPMLCGDMPFGIKQKTKKIDGSITEVTAEDSLNAIRFNVTAYLLQIL